MGEGVAIPKFRLIFILRILYRHLYVAQTRRHLFFRYDQAQLTVPPLPHHGIKQIKTTTKLKHFKKFYFQRPQQAVFPISDRGPLPTPTEFSSYSTYILRFFLSLTIVFCEIKTAQFKI